MSDNAAAQQGWYLYGITRCGSLASSEATPVQLLELAGLAAVVMPVNLADFSLAVLQERMSSASALETMVRSHNSVIEAIHAQQPILPAKFGSVYARPDDVVSALRSAHDSLLRQLERLEGCDEWAVHLYADRAALRGHISQQDPALQRLRAELAEARPGRAYFLERQLRAQLEDATEHALERLAQHAFDRLADCAVDAQVSPLAPGAADDDDVEILRAAFLVSRERAEDFAAEVRACADARAGLSTECSGPWPPYSFAGAADEGAA